MNNSDLSPHHLGEALVARLLNEIDICGVPVHDPGAPGTTTTMGARFALKAEPTAVVANAILQPAAGRPGFDGMHSIDCALVFDAFVIAMELKLGKARLEPKTFNARFLDDRAPRLSHNSERIAGNMIALLDWNGRVAPPGQPEIELRCKGPPMKSVNPSWLLMLRRDTWNAWKSTASLLTVLGTRQLAGIVTLEDLAETVGIPRAKEIALDLARTSIDTWFPT